MFHFLGFISIPDGVKGLELDLDSFQFVKCYVEVSGPMLDDSHLYLIKCHARVAYKIL